MRTELPLSRDLVLIGGGHTHALVLRKWGMRALAGARLTLINPTVSAPYTGMLPGHVAGHYTRDEIDIDLVRLTRFAGARLVLDKATGIDRDARLVHLAGRPPLRYDIASINVGVTSDLSEIEGFAALGHSAKPLGRFASAWKAFLDHVQSSGSKADCVIIGGGVAGAELALAMAHRLRTVDGGTVSITVVESGAGFLRQVSAPARAKLFQSMDHYGIARRVEARVEEVREGTVVLAGGEALAADFIVSTAGARPHAWISGTGLAVTDGYVDVGPDLRATNDEFIFAAGDCAHLAISPRPKAGVFAVRQAPVLHDNLRAALMEVPLPGTYRAQRHYLKLISEGHKAAVAEKFGLSVSGPVLWKLKDRIDRRFLARLGDLPLMAEPAPAAEIAAHEDEENADRMLCGGCGSKVASHSLRAGLSAMLAPIRSDTARGEGDDAARLLVGDKTLVISTDHLRAFTADHYVMAQIAAVHALGDIWAMGASPQAALLSLVLPQMSERMQADTLAEIMAAVSAVLRDAGADLIGGHTSMGRELTIGLTVTGLAGERVIGLDGAMPGDGLILTKPIGSGVILAAEMRALASGRDVESAFRCMRRPIARASGIVRPVAHAMTDVTGFGLAGHLMNILDASGVRARISVDAIPILPGAAELAGQGVRSSIWHANAKISERMTRPGLPKEDLLFDPQTAGGLLAAVPASETERILTELSEAGETAALIGSIEQGSPAILAG